jgi:hypothetical protein
MPETDLGNIGAAPMAPRAFCHPASWNSLLRPQERPQGGVAEFSQ